MATWDEVEVCVREWTAGWTRARDRADDILSEAWLLWHACKREDVPASSFLWFASKRVSCGRSAKGLNVPVIDALHARQGATMGCLTNLPDWRPGPLGSMQLSEAVTGLLTRTTGKKKLLVMLALAGYQGTEIASELEVTPGRVSQIRAELKAEFDPAL